MKTISLMLAGAAALICSHALVSTPALADDTANQPQPKACLRFGEIYNWKAVDPKTLIIEDDRHQKFKVGLMSYCPNLAFKEAIGIKSMGATYLSCVDRGDDIVVHDFGFPQHCPIVSIELYTKEMEAADKAAAEAKAKDQTGK